MDNPKRAKLAFKVHCGKLRTLQQKMNEFGRGLTREEKERLVGDLPRLWGALDREHRERLCEAAWKYGVRQGLVAAQEAEL